ncbi:prolyl-tRNA synthetase [Pisolithus thermaeus]|nr:prolyl-tRNA synthetase [Pisolithus thermaeus]
MDYIRDEGGGLPATRWLESDSAFRERVISKPSADVIHAETNSPAAWHEALQSATSVPPSFELIKTLVYKPKTAKTAVPVPVVVIARDDTETSSSALAKKLGLKELRLASEDLLDEFFKLDKNSLSFLALNKESFPRVVTVVDSSIASTQDTIFAIHALSSSSTIFLSGKTLETDELRIQEVDFTALKTEQSTATPVSGANAARSGTREKEDPKIEGAVQIAIGVKKEVDFSAWYQSVLLKADMLEYYSVSGCYILRPWSYSIWEEIQDWFNKRIKAMGVQNVYFPMFVSSKVLEREKDHIEGFSPEVAWVTRAGSSELEEPIAIRPTSETVMYPCRCSHVVSRPEINYDHRLDYAKWVKSHRDLPLKLNQWNNVVRWEFKHPRKVFYWRSYEPTNRAPTEPFLRTREYLWQEGHTAHLSKADADKEVLEILELYRRVYEELLAVPMVKGVKSEKEKFAGALYTTTVEGFIPASGRGIQAGTSHCLGQNFSRPEMFNIVVEDPNDPSGQGKLYAWQNSWGLSTRTIGVMVMVHGDNQGLVLPPRVAYVQVVVVPCGITAKTGDAERNKINEACDELAKSLVDIGIRAKADLREGYTPGYKFNDWEQKGVPLRLEIGPNDLVKQQTVSVRRDTGAKAPIPLSELKAVVPGLLETIHKDMYTKALNEYNSRLKEVTRWEDFVPTLDNKCIAVIPWCEEEACEDDIKERSARSAEPQDERAPSAGAKSLAIPFDQDRFTPLEPGKSKCVGCGKDAKRWTMFGRSY